jgi:hypothetical protein
MNYAPMVDRARELFVAHAEGGKVRFDYDCKLYYGLLN